MGVARQILRSFEMTKILTGAIFVIDKVTIGIEKLELDAAQVKTILRSLLAL